MCVCVLKCLHYWDETVRNSNLLSVSLEGGNVEDSGSDEVTSFRKIDQAHTFVGYV